VIDSIRISELSYCIFRGNKFSNISQNADNTYLFTASNEPLAKSMTPAVGRVTSPITPLPTPLKNPSTPSCFAPDIGFRITPDTPSTTPYMIKCKNKLLLPIASYVGKITEYKCALIVLTFPRTEKY